MCIRDRDRSLCLLTHAYYRTGLCFYSHIPHLQDWFLHLLTHSSTTRQVSVSTQTFLDHRICLCDCVYSHIPQPQDLSVSTHSLLNYRTGLCVYSNIPQLQGRSLCLLKHSPITGQVCVSIHVCLDHRTSLCLLTHALTTGQVSVSTHTCLNLSLIHI